MQTPRTDPPSGKQYHLTYAGYHAVVVEVGAGIRLLEHHDRPVLESYSEDAICDGAHGAHLLPWPNRVFGGKYRFRDQEYALPLTEVEAGNAIHGLVRWHSFNAIRLTQSSATLETTLHPTPWYPFRLVIQFHYELSSRGLTVITEVINRSLEACPFALGHHPYLSPGKDQTIDQAVFSATATHIELATDTVQTDTAQTDTAHGSHQNLETPMPVGDRILDTTFAVHTAAHTSSWARLKGTDGRTVELWADQSYRYLQVFTGDTLPSWRRRRAMAVEPMTAPPNALQSGQDLLILEPEEILATQWGVQLQ
ncbi:hypothetical protein [Ferrimicrobium sp.]|uniref:aldose epimerase family protein n=1 Tax=Ferrimicrobium sp. TaxID=2926050 RepID=UPI002620C94E|nr:hypothetical protein [Ferrimicrobium sp.]